MHFREEREREEEGGGGGREKERYGETHREKQRASELRNKIELRV